MKAHGIEIVVTSPGQPIRRLSFDVGVVLHLGRAMDNDVVLCDIGVSRRHARLLVEADGVFLEDMGSGNGTYFRGERIRRLTVNNGDEVLVEPFTLRFVLVPSQPSSGDGLTGSLEDVDDEDTVEVMVQPQSSEAKTAAQIAQDSQPRARLVTLVGHRLAPGYPVRPDGLSIGRSDSQDIILFDPSASRSHARLSHVGPDIWLQDDGSGNGTFVNGSRVREQCLRHGDRIRVGSTEFRFEFLDGFGREPPTLPQAKVRVKRLAYRAPDTAPVPTGRQSRPRGPRMVAMAAVGGFAIVLMLITGGLLALYVLDPILEVPAGGVKVSEPSLTAPARQHLVRGRALFEQARYLDAASQYYAVLSLAPGHPEATRMGALSTEYLTLGYLKKGLVLRSLSESEKLKFRRKSLRLAKRALAGSGKRAEAEAALMDTLVIWPKDPAVMALLASLRS